MPAPETLQAWTNLLPTNPSQAEAVEYLYYGATNNDPDLVRQVLLYARANSYDLDITHAVHLSCVYAQHEVLKVLEQHTPLTKHHVRTGLYSASSGCQVDMLSHVLERAYVLWGQDTAVAVEGNNLMAVVCTPGNVSEATVLDCIKLLEPILENPELSDSVLSLLNFGHPNATQHIIPYSDLDVLLNKAQQLNQTHPFILQWVESAVLKEKLTQATATLGAPIPRVHKKI